MFKYIDHEGTPTPSLLIRSRTPYRISHASLLLFWYFVYGLTNGTSVDWNTGNKHRHRELTSQEASFKFLSHKTDLACCYHPPPPLPDGKPVPTAFRWISLKIRLFCLNPWVERGHVRGNFAAQENNTTLQFGLGMRTDHVTQRKPLRR